MNYNKFSLGAVMICAALTSCDKSELRATETETPTDKAFVRIALHSPGTPAVMIKANDVKLNGNFTSGNGGYFPSTVTFPDYAAVAPNSTFKLSLANTGTQNDSVVLFNAQLAIEAGKFYSLTLADTGINRTAFAIEDQFLPQKDSMISIRLINAMVGSTLHLIRVDSTSSSNFERDTIAKNIPYKGSSGFVQVKTFTTRSFIRIRVATTDGRVYTQPAGGTVVPGQTPPQALATGSRRSITYYATGILGGTGIYAPGLSAHITNQ